MPLASLMANGDAGDAITLRIVAAATTVTATRPRGGWSKEGEILVRTRPFAAFFCVLMGLLLCGGRCMSGQGERGDRWYTGRVHHWRLFAATGSFPLSSSHCPRLTSSLLVNSCNAEISCFLD